MHAIGDNIEVVKEKIAQAAARAGRRPEDIQLVAVTKGVDARRIEEAVAAGLKVFGENRVQEAKAKVDQLPLDIHWHMIGHLQRNKVKDALRIFEMIHSVDSLRLAHEINRLAEKYAKRMDILLEMNISGETTKYGFAPQELEAVIGEIEKLQYIVIKGLMAMTPFVDDPETVRPVFAGLRELGMKLASQRHQCLDIKYLSMGMSQDYEVAIEEGANMVRIGTAIFGERS